MGLETPNATSNLRIGMTGAAGSLGCDRCGILLSQNNQVIFLDDFCSASRKNLAHLLDQSEALTVAHFERVLGSAYAEAAQ